MCTLVGYVEDRPKAPEPLLLRTWYCLETPSRLASAPALTMATEGLTSFHTDLPAIPDSLAGIC